MNVLLESCDASEEWQELFIVADGALIVGASRLTSRLWTGELSYFNSCTKDTVISDRNTGALLDCGVTDVKWLGSTRRLVAACDSGSVPSLMFCYVIVVMNIWLNLLLIYFCYWVRDDSVVADSSAQCWTVGWTILFTFSSSSDNF